MDTGADTGSSRLGSATNLEEFVALVSHEVRTPLTIAKAAAQSVLGHGEDGVIDLDRRVQLLEMIDRNIDLAILLLDRLQLARSLEEGRFELDVRTIDFARLVRESVSDLRQVVLRDHPTEVTAPDTMEIRADATVAREIVFNLLSNAAKYSADDAPIAVTIEEEGTRVTMVVRNHGGGVTPGDSERIFSKFFQGDQGSSGVGLGLFISRGLARAHGGDIYVRAAADVGSEFVLKLPRIAESTS